MRDAWAAAAAVVASRGDIFDGEAYARTRRADRERTIRFTDGLAELFTMDAPGLPLARTAMLTVLDGFGPARRRFGRALSLGQL